jgi:ribosome-associated toxin RatA of RatAB toxin-antitoxin module
MLTDLVMVSRAHHGAAAGRQHARRLFVSAALIVMTVAVPSADLVNAPRIAVTEAAGLFNVTASFAVTESPDDVVAVLTDYERIPHYMPDMELSRVIERTSSGAVVEQQAVSKFMMFSKRIHLVLDIHEGPSVIRFRDRCRRSFAAYEGSWIISQHDSLTVVDYQLSAKPSFEVPAFVLKRLLKRDAGQLVDRIKAEIAARADRRQ